MQMRDKSKTNKKNQYYLLSKRSIRCNLMGIDRQTEQKQNLLMGIILKESSV
jgi:hypothetical protein